MPSKNCSGKDSPDNSGGAGDMGAITGLERPPGGNGNPLPLFPAWRILGQRSHWVLVHGRTEDRFIEHEHESKVTSAVSQHLNEYQRVNMWVY